MSPDQKAILAIAWTMICLGPPAASALGGVAFGVALSAWVMCWGHR